VRFPYFCAYLISARLTLDMIHIDYTNREGEYVADSLHCIPERPRKQLVGREVGSPDGRVILEGHACLPLAKHGVRWGGWVRWRINEPRAGGGCEMISSAGSDRCLARRTAGSPPEVVFPMVAAAGHAMATASHIPQTSDRSTR
jgi:hypothetical protein